MVPLEIVPKQCLDKKPGEIKILKEGTSPVYCFGGFLEGVVWFDFVFNETNVKCQACVCMYSDFVFADISL